MNFGTIDYIDWFRINWHDIEYDLATSGVHAITQRDLGIQMDDLNFGKTLFFGHPDLVRNVSDIYGVSEKEVLVTSGSTHANYIACALLLHEGDEVIIEDPVYTPLLDLVKAFNCRIRPLERRHDEGYSLNVERLNEMVTKDTKLIIATNLHNPSGIMTDENKFKALSEIARDNNVHVLSDEVYRDFMGISTCSLSKFYGGGALRVGWALADPGIVDKGRKLNDYLTAVNSCAGESFGALILEKRKWYVDKVKNITKNNYPIVKEWMEGRSDLEWVEPRYGVIAFPKILGGFDSMELAMLLLNKFRTMISPGRFFGPEDHFRIGFGGDEVMVKGGLEKLGLALDELGKEN
jgi:aspartate/methionine/tyrosine aminotransferase